MLFAAVLALLVTFGQTPATQPTAEATTRPAAQRIAMPGPTPKDMAPPGPLGFALYGIYDPIADSKSDNLIEIEGRLNAYLYDVNLQIIAKVRRGDVLPKPYEDWRLVGIPLFVNGRPRIVIANVKTLQIVQLEQSAVARSADR